MESFQGLELLPLNSCTSFSTAGQDCHQCSDHLNYPDLSRVLRTHLLKLQGLLMETQRLTGTASEKLLTGACNFE